jgi:sirohydrochlorin cobaltochelatase
MKKIKFFMLATMAVLVSASFTACSSDSDDTQNNEQKYQDIVRQTVHDQKKSDKALLLVAFGSTWQDAFDDFDATVDAYKKEFPGYDVYISFSSAICRNRAAAGEHQYDPVKPAQVRNYYAPERWLNAFGHEKYADITVQSLQVIPGEEYGRVVNALKDFANNGNNDLDNSYLKTVKLHLGTPLMATGSDDVTEANDVKNLAVELDKIYGTKAAEGAMLFMGHGNPDEYDTYKANIRYTQLENVLRAMNKPYANNYFVGTVDMMGNFKTDVKNRMQIASITSGSKVFCAPLMSIAGDHANNDMAGDDAGWIKNEETGEYEETSWKVYFADTRGGSYTCNDETMVVKGLLSYPAIRQLWINHTKEAQEVDLDWFHSNDGTE